MANASRKRIRTLETRLCELADVLTSDDGAPLELGLENILALPDEDEEDKFFDAVRKLEEAWRDVYTPPLRAPRLRRLRQSELPAIPLWTFWRRERFDVAIMRMLGVPLVVYDALCDHAREYLPAFDDAVLRKGPPSRFDYFDVVSITLRRLQVYGPKWLEILETEYGATAAVVWRALDAGIPAVIRVLRKLPGAAVRYSTVAELREAWEGFVAQHGPPPWADKHVEGPFKGHFKWPEIAGIPLGHAMDGTATPALKPGNQIKQKVMRSGNKGDIFNHVITTTLLGVVDYGSCVAGTFTDSRTSGPQLDRAADAALNPGHQFATVLDNGWRFPASFPLPDAYAAYREYKPGTQLLMRPLRDGDKAPKGLAKYYERCSAYITVFRQHGEWLNGGLKRQFPVLLNPVRKDQENNLRCTFEMVCKEEGGEGPQHDFLAQHPRPPTPPLVQCVRLYNLRARMGAWNQLRTTYLRHADANFREQLKNSTDSDEYLKKISHLTEALAFQLMMTPA